MRPAGSTSRRSGRALSFGFTIDYSLLNGGSVGVGDNVIQYFVVAQDPSERRTSASTGHVRRGPDERRSHRAAFPIGGTINSYTDRH